MRALPLVLLLFAPVLHAQIAPQPEDDVSEGDVVRTELPDTAFRRAPVRLVYDHVERTTTLLSPNGEVDEVWERTDGTPFAEVPTDRPVVVEVRNANALVYGYNVQATVSELLDAPRSCGGQARSFVLAGGLLGVSALSPGFDVSLPDGGSFEDYLGTDLAGIASLLASRSATFTSSELTSIRQDATSPVRQLAAFAERLERTRTEAEAALVRAARLGDVEPIDPMLAAIQAELDAAIPGLSDPARAPVVVGDLSPDVSETVPALLAAAEAVEARNVEEPDGASAQGVVELAALATEAAQTAAEAEAALQRLAFRVERAREASHQRVTVRPGDDLREVAIEVAPAADPVEGVLPTRTGVVRAYLGPAPSRGFGCAVAVALTFSPRPTAYDVRFGNGTLFDNTEDGLRTAPAVLFEVAPPSIGSVLGLVGGVGLGSEAAPDFYAGGSLRVLSPVLIVGGAVWSRVRALPEGVRLGDVVAEADDFDTDAFLDDLPREWRPSLFLGLSVVP